jgi:hypothetical protein
VELTKVPKSGGRRRKKGVGGKKGEAWRRKWDPRAAGGPVLLLCHCS